MKKKSIESLWMGTPDISFDSSQEEVVVKKIHEARKCYIELENAVNDDAKELLHKYINVQSTVNDLEKKNSFVAGFRLGVRLVVESIED